WTLALSTAVMHALRTNQSSAKLALRKRLASARRYFAQQLKSSDPHLRDDWFPWLVAFGLGDNVDAWFRSSARSSTSSSFTKSDSASSSTGGSSGGWSFSGGGGAFGGAGASGAWAVAAGSLASGVSAPSSR